MNAFKEQYVGRPRYSVALSLTMDREAAEYLRSLAGQRNLGRIVSRLVYEERARMEERQRIVQVIAGDRHAD